MVFGVLLATGGKAQAASWVEINEKNFPDKASREYLIGNSETQSENFKERNGKYYVNVSGVTELYRGSEDQTIKDTDFLKKFKRLSSLGITTSDSTVKLPASVKSVMIEFKGKMLELSAPGATELRLDGAHKRKSDYCFLKLRDVSKLEKLSIYDIKGISGLSGLKNLEEVDMGDNLSTRIDLSKSAGLSRVNITDASMLTSVRLPYGIEYLTLSNTRLSQIDVRKQKKLKTLTCSNSRLSSLKMGKNNKITLIDVSGNEKLAVKLNSSMYPELSYLDVSGTAINKIDVTKYKKLETLKAADTAIRTLNVTKNRNLSDLDVSGTKKLNRVNVTQNRKLWKLNVSNTNIKTLNVTQNIKLYLLNVSGAKKIKSLNVTKCQNLSSLYTTGSGIDNINISKNKALDTLYPTNAAMKIKGINGRDMNLVYVGLKNGSVISLSDIAGSGYKLKRSSKNVRFNSRTMNIKTLQVKARGYIYFEKGECTLVITFKEKDKDVIN